ncbi:MAG TPA: PAS domain S-box protein [Solirubrobacteraceae bacterium]|nr:PAS domain S-box protein [Solirubrobacteraceae bacterium]
MSSPTGSAQAFATSSEQAGPFAPADGPSRLRDDGAPAGVVVIDARARILHVSGRAFEAHGLSTEGWIGASAEEVFPAEALPTLRHRFQAALGGAPQSFSYRSVDTGRVYVVQLVPVPDATGSIASVVASMQDATEHLRMTAELERSEGRLREAERMVGVGSWELVLASGEITYSAGLARLLELEPGQRLDTRSHMELVHPDDRAFVAEIRAQCVRQGSTSGEYRVILPSGTRRTLSLHAEVVFQADGGREHLRGAVLDVTDQREAERRLAAAEHLFRQGFDASPIGSPVGPNRGPVLSRQRCPVPAARPVAR